MGLGYDNEDDEDSVGWKKIERKRVDNLVQKKVLWVGFQWG